MKITTANIKDIYKSEKSSIETMELKGYELIENLFVDSSGFGAEDEMALTGNQFEKRVLEIVAKEGTVTAKITDAGQFQVYVGLFKKTGTSKVEKIGNNTYRVDYPTSEAIRLHDTDILTFEADHVTLNSGGWQTHTTKARLNEYLPAGVHVEQKNFDWYVVDSRDNTRKEFQDGMTIAA